MTRGSDRPDQPLLPPLDDEAGPLPSLSAAEADAVAWAAVSGWAARPPGLEPADAAPGPARPLTEESAQRLARSALRQHAQRQRSKQGFATWLQRAAAVALCLFGVVGVSFAAYRLWPALFETPKPRPAATSSMSHAANVASQPQTHSDPPAAEPSVATVSGNAPAAVRSQAKPDSDALLARANALRAKRRWVSAEATYRQVLAADPSTPQRYVALIAAASIALEHLEKPTRALALYESALALMPRGNLDEEALFGVAACQRALEHPVAELRALERLTQHHPNGLYAAAAQRRVAELEGQ